ncbi:hypothetical protein Pyn_14979 [Prunus yedoensis var. nudiflora]|uniref:Uncharacterized protein n=1 Tax=Prunus yedoensis var. nudiflora TaxID=2094558 RepID=A0A314YNB2_PRUYE|nr:hypothetical protein Pyn_14979 [Prunus yedoensis var. nudiflora]
MEGEHETMVLLAAGVSKNRRIMGTEVDEQNLTKSKPTVEQQFCEVRLRLALILVALALKCCTLEGMFHRSHRE